MKDKILFVKTQILHTDKLITPIYNILSGHSYEIIYKIKLTLSFNVGSAPREMRNFTVSTLRCSAAQMIGVQPPSSFERNENNIKLLNYK